MNIIIILNFLFCTCFFQTNVFLTQTMLLISRLETLFIYCNKFHLLGGIFLTLNIFSHVIPRTQVRFRSLKSQSPPPPPRQQEMQETFSNFHVSSSGTSPGRVGGGGRSIGGAVAAPPPLRLTIFNCHASNDNTHTHTLFLFRKIQCSCMKSYNRLNYRHLFLCANLRKK